MEDEDQLKLRRKMALQTKLSNVCPFKLHEIFDTLYELQQRLGISADEYLFNTTPRDSHLANEVQSESLRKLLDASKKTRDNLVTWHCRQTLAELNVTISLLTAKIKFIEYQLGLCEGLDLHQACSLSLVNFCNILADITVQSAKPGDRRTTMHEVSIAANIPVWLSNYRNQICHLPSESPCISILLPLVAKSLEYMRDSFWTKLIERETFNSQRCRRLISTIANFTDITSVNQHMELRRGIELGKKKMKLAEANLVKSAKACACLRRMLYHNPEQVLDLVTSFLCNHPPKSKIKNCGLLLEQVILGRCLERLINRVITQAEERPTSKNVSSWLQRLIALIGLRTKDHIRESLNKMDVNISVKMIRLTDVSSVKCCQIAYRLIKLDQPVVSKLVIKLRHKLIPILGKERTLLLIRLTNIVK